MNPVDDVSINTLVGSGTTIRGELSVAGFVRVDGDIDGDLETTGRIIVGERARIRGTVRCRIITVGGVIQGDVVAPDGVTILSSGTVLGSVITKKLQVEPDVILHGSCFAVNDEQQFGEALSGYNNRQAMRRSSRAAPASAGVI